MFSCFSAFEWNVGNETDWNNRVPIVRIRNVAKGLSHPSLVKANKKASRTGTTLFPVTAYFSLLQACCLTTSLAPRSRAQQFTAVFSLLRCSHAKGLLVHLRPSK